MPTPNHKWYGWKKDELDQRDLLYTHVISQAALPSKVDLRKYVSTIQNQGALGSCTAQALAGALEMLQNYYKLTDKVNASRLFIYYNERAIEGTINRDSGAYLRDGIKTLAKQGACDEKLWPYKIKDFKKKPTAACYKQAKKYLIDEYMRVPQVLDSLKSALVSSFPIIFGFSVYESFETPAVERTGVVPMPKKSEKLLGGHAVIAVGYDDSKGVFICKNSWGSSWGDKGYFYMPYGYLTTRNLSADFWVIRVP